MAREVLTLGSMKTIVSWKGKTVYRKCECGETAHDAKYLTVSPEVKALMGDQFTYPCRNCSKLAQFRK